MLSAKSPMNGAAVANPLSGSIQESQRVIDQLADASDRLQKAVDEERKAYGRLQEVKDFYDGAEAEYLAEAAVNAAAKKDGPLTGIPVSSDGYKYAMTKLRTELRNDLLSDMWADLDACQLQYEQARIERQQAETQFSALKATANLRAAMLYAAAM